MTFRVDTSPLEDTSLFDDHKFNCDEAKALLEQMLHDFPYESINLEKDIEFTELLKLLEKELKLDLDRTLIPKSEILNKLNEEYKLPPKFYNPAQDVCHYFDLVSKNQEAKKLEHFESLQKINKDLELLGKALSFFQISSSLDKVDFSTNDEAKIVIEQVRALCGFPETKLPYVFENKTEVCTFLNQKIKELTHRSSETMLHLQHGADQLKAMVDITKSMIEEDSKLKDYIIRKNMS